MARQPASPSAAAGFALQSPPKEFFPGCKDGRLRCSAAGRFSCAAEQFTRPSSLNLGKTFLTDPVERDPF